jgi:O-antigen ligase/tetratricopeptide (TPR) repeat protein
VLTRAFEARSRLVALSGFAVLAYLIVLGGTPPVELDADIRVLNAGIASALIAIYVLRLGRLGDGTDRGVLVALLLFVGAGSLSAFPRQSFDAALAALAYAAGLFVARGVLSNNRDRALFVSLMIFLSAVITVATAILWVPVVALWLSQTGGATPPLGLDLTGFLWGHRYDLSLLLVLLYPSWWIGAADPARWVGRLLIGVVTLALVLLGGSRTVWLACVVAGGIVLAPSLLRRWPRQTRTVLAIAGGALVAMVALAVIGVLGVSVDRLLSFGTITARIDMWALLTSLWLQHPIAGFGPGSFPWLLQQTTYFDTTYWAPRHPDSVVFQLLPEVGLLGVTAVTVVLWTLVPRILRLGAPAVRWALAVFVVAGVGTSTTDFAFLVVVALAWVAYAVPREARQQKPGGPIGKAEIALKASSIGAVFVIGVAYLLTLVAAYQYDDARAAIGDSRGADAEHSLKVAVNLDPALALYWRQLASLYLLRNAPGLALEDLTRAQHLNPNDDLTRRGQALAYFALGNADAAESSIAEAIRLQRSDPTNLLLGAWLDEQAGRSQDAIARLGEIVQAWPTVVGAPGWQVVAPDAADTARAIDEGVRRWEQDLSTLEPPVGQGLWLALFENRPALATSGPAAAGVSPTLARAFLAAWSCDPSAALILNQSTDADRRTALYWLIHARILSNAGASDQDSIRVYKILSRDPLEPGETPVDLNPLDENAWPGFSADAWGYRRHTIDWPAYAIHLPSSQEGLIRWLWDPPAAIREAGLQNRIPRC